jgi:DNA-binding NtrC family response regulator
MRKGAKRYGREPLFISQQMMNALVEYGWPGNLRELENVINRYLVLGSERAICNELAPFTSPQLPSSALHTMGAGASGLKRMVRTLKGEAESVVIAEALKGTGWNRKAAASDLKISYKALLYKIKQYNLEPQNRVAI